MSDEVLTPSQSEAAVEHPLAEAEEGASVVPVAPVPTTVLASAEQCTPLEWATRKGHVLGADPLRPWRSPNVDYRYAAADALYGWTHHAYHFQAEHERFLLTEPDYDAALEAAAAYPAAPPYEPAIAPSCPHDLSAEAAMRRGPR